MDNYKHLFSLPDNIHYINGAYMSPSLKSVSEAGRSAILQKDNPTSITTNDFFTPVQEVKNLYGKIINASEKQISIIPSASYGFANAFNNCQPKGRKKAICVGGEFPSGYFTLVRWCQEHQIELEVIHQPTTDKSRGKIWNQEVLDAINSDTALVLIMSVHWMDGTIFNLREIGKKCFALGVDLLVDGTQSVGAQAIDVPSCHITALINPSYKWLLGPYGIGAAYYAPGLDDGQPLEESWMNRIKAADFANLTDYNEQYKSGAARYDIGESASFIHIAMMKSGLQFLLDFGVEKIESYCRQLTQPLCEYLQANEFWIEEEAFRSAHLFGFELPERINVDQLKIALKENKIHLSFRKNAIRVSPNIYNTAGDMQALVSCLKKVS